MMRLNLKRLLERVELINDIKKFRRDRKVWDMPKHKNWGDSISFFSNFDFKGFSITGHCYGIRTGDELLVDMKSGRKLSCVITNIEYKSDPKDMFFGSARPVQYLRCLKNIKLYKKLSKKAGSDE